MLQYALKRKMTSKGEKHSHWLEFASDKYDAQLIDDIKRVLRVGLVFLPLPVFWALYDQQVSTYLLRKILVSLIEESNLLAFSKIRRMNDQMNKTFDILHSRYNFT